MNEEIKPVKPCRTCGVMDRNKSGRCRPCIKVNNAKWRAENPEKIMAISAKWRLENPEKIKAFRARWYAENTQKVIANHAIYNAKLKESAAAKTFFQMLAGAAAIADYIKEQNNKKTA